MWQCISKPVLIDGTMYNVIECEKNVTNLHINSLFIFWRHGIMTAKINLRQYT